MLQALGKWILSFWHSEDNVFIFVHSFVLHLISTQNSFPDTLTMLQEAWTNDTMTEIRRYQQSVSHKWTANSVYFMLSTLQWTERLPYFGQQREILPVTAWLISGVWTKPFPPPRIFTLRPHESCGEGLIAMDVTFLFTLPCHSTVLIALVLGVNK